MLKIGSGIRASVAGLAVSGAIATAAVPAQAGDYSGDFMVRVLGTVVDPDADGAAGAGTIPVDVSTEVIPALTLSYFFNKNVAVELFCCFAKHQAEIPGADAADFWIFPPALTLQYHFDSMGGFKPYVGAGIQYIKFFDVENKLVPGGAADIDDALGFTLQAGFDMEIGQGWYLNADVKKTWLDTDVTLAGAGPTFGLDVDPWIFSVGVGYRFNLSDIFGARHAEAPMK
jgi:outer membrane protein